MADRPFEPTHATPRWVKMFGICVIVLVVLLAILHLTGHRFGGHAALDQELSSSGVPKS